MSAKRRLQYKGVHYTLIYDEEDTLDTVTITGQEELLSSKNKSVSYFIRHADKILGFKDVKGISYQR